MTSGISRPTSTPTPNTIRYSTSLNGAASQVNTRNSATAEKPPSSPTINSIWMKRPIRSRVMYFDSHEPTPMANR